MTTRGCSRSVWELGPIGEQGVFPEKGTWTQQTIEGGHINRGITTLILKWFIDQWKAVDHPNLDLIHAVSDNIKEDWMRILYQGQPHR